MPNNNTTSAKAQSNAIPMKLAFQEIDEVLEDLGTMLIEMHQEKQLKGVEGRDRMIQVILDQTYAAQSIMARYMSIAH